MMDFIASVPGHLIAAAETNPVGFVAAVLMTAATITAGIRYF